MTMIQISKSEDLEIIRELSIATFTQTFASMNTEEDLAKYIAQNYSPEVLRAEIDNPQSIFLVAAVDGKIAGYMKLNTGSAQTEDVDEQSLEIQRLYILEQFKRHGLGTRFMNTAFDIAQTRNLDSIWLGVWEHNEPAKAFYGKMGFLPFSEHVFQLGDDKQTDILMRTAVPHTEQ